MTESGVMTMLKDQTRWKVTREENEYVIKGKMGQVSMYGDDELDVWVCTWEPAASNLWPIKAKQSEHRSNRMEREGWKAKQHYDDGGLFIRPWADLDRACMYIKARKRRQVTEAMRQAGRAHAQNLRSTLRDLGLNGLKTDQTPPEGGGLVVRKRNEPINPSSSVS